LREYANSTSDFNVGTNHGRSADTVFFEFRESVESVHFTASRKRNDDRVPSQGDSAEDAHHEQRNVFCVESGDPTTADLDVGRNDPTVTHRHQEVHASKSHTQQRRFVIAPYSEIVVQSRFQLANAAFGREKGNNTTSATSVISGSQKGVRWRDFATFGNFGSESLRRPYERRNRFVGSDDGKNDAGTKRGVEKKKK
jgi:hypothetical protein